MPLGRKIILGITVLIGCPLILWMFLNQLDWWELNALTYRQQFIQESRPGITLISIDDKTQSNPDMNRLFGRFPWPRKTYAYVVRFLRRAHPEKVQFDLSFHLGQDTQTPQSDAEFVDSLRGSAGFGSDLNFVPRQQQGLPPSSLSQPVQTMLAREALTVSGLSYFPNLGNHFTDGLLPPFDGLTSVMDFYSLASILPDRSNSNTMRQWIPFTIYGDRVFPDETLGMLLDGSRQINLSPNGVMSFGNHHVRLGSDGLPYIKWYGNQFSRELTTDNPINRLLLRLKRVIQPTYGNGFHPYKEYSMWDVIQSELVLECDHNPRPEHCGEIDLPKQPIVLPSQFDDQYVFIGTTSINSFDSHPSIYDGANGGMQYPGVYVLANVFDNLLHDDFVFPAPLWMNLLLFLTTCGLVLWMSLRFEQILNALMGTLLLVLGHFCFTTYAYLHWNLWVNAVYPIAGMMLCYSGGYIYRYKKTQKTKEQLRFAFGKYVSPSVMQMIEKSPDAVRLGGQRQEMTMLFCDIRGFTTYSENHSPENVQSFLTQYFSIMNEIILKRYSGTINKLIGDAIFAYWGFPLKTEEHALLAVSAALAMQEAILEWQQDPTKPPVNIGIGIHTGDVMVGNVGSEDFMDFTLIGDAVNTASRLEHLTKDLGVRVVISEATYERIRNFVEARPLGQTKIRGKEAELGIYEPLKLNL